MATTETGPEPAGPRFPLLARATPPLLAAVVLIFLASFSRRPFRSFDTYFHLRFGEELASGRWSISDPGQVSSASTNDWVPTQWLPQVVMAETHSLFGTDGLTLLFGVLLVSVAVAVYCLVRMRTGPLLAVLLTGAAVVSVYPWLSLRPQMISFALAAVVLASWQNVRRGGLAPWWLVPMGWLWAMCHGMWILGVGISCVAVLGLVLELRPRRRDLLTWAAVPVGMMVAACLTPVGPRLVSAVLLVNSRSAYFAEWAAPELLSAKGAFAAVLLAATAVLMLVHHESKPYDVTMLGLGGLFALYSWRTLPLAVLVLAPLLGGLLQQYGAARHRPGRAETAILATAAALTALAGPLVRPDVERGIADDLDAFASQTTDLRDGTVVVTDRATGSALMWASPALDVPFHGYGDVYTDAELERLDDLAFLNEGWDDTLRALGARIALLPEDHRLAYALRMQAWTVEREAHDLVWLEAPPGWLRDSGGTAAAP